jgi:hypothetical protein
MRTAPLLAIAALAATVSVAGAQATDDTIELQRPVRGAAGGNLYYAKPVGEFSDYINRGWGGSAHAMLLVGESGALGLRIDASYMNYGRETVRDVCALPGVCRVVVDVTTTNNIAFFGAGPQLMVPNGPVRPYVAGQVGWTFIWTNSSIEDADDEDESVLDTQNVSDNTFSYGGLGGILIPISSGRNPVSLDLGVRYLRNGNVRYLRKGDIVDNPTGPPTLNIQRSRADLLTYFVGVSVGLR